MKFRFLTAGESHGKVLTAIVEGLPSNIEIDVSEINAQLARRQKGYGRGGRMQIETDQAEITSGVRFGVSTGAPVTLTINNKDWENWTIPMSAVPVDLKNEEIKIAVGAKKITYVRPGHADLAGAIKYNQSDVRNILERSSARETAARVAVGALAKIFLYQFGIEIFSHVLQIGSVKADLSRLGNDYRIIKDKAELSDLSCVDENAAEKMRELIDRVSQDGDTLGGIVQVVATGVPVGLGSHVQWDRKLDGRIAQAFMSIQAIKSVGIGIGEEAGKLLGSEVHDEIFPKKDGLCFTRKTNNAGGIEGGISNGEAVLVQATMKPIPTLRKTLNSINLEDGNAHASHYERSDVCAVPAAGTVMEAMLAIVLADAFLEKFGGDSLEEIESNFNSYMMKISTNK